MLFVKCTVEQTAELDYTELKDKQTYAHLHAKMKTTIRKLTVIDQNKSNANILACHKHTKASTH